MTEQQNMSLCLGTNFKVHVGVSQFQEQVFCMC
jgi:hypothetical protein